MRCADRPSVTIATWNVWKPTGPGDPRSDAIARKLAAITADIWVLTETHAALHPPDTVEAASSPGDQPKREPHDRSAMIWVRSDWEARPLPTFPDRSDATEPATAASYAVRGPATSPAACALVQTPLGPLIVYGTIITWAGDQGPTRQSTRYATETLHAITAHDADWRRLRREHPDTPLCVAGDLNTTLDGRPSPTKDCSTRLRAALALADVRHVTRTLNHTIDHICLPPGWAEHASDPTWWQTTYIDGSGEPRPASDHLGVVVTVGA